MKLSIKAENGGKFYDYTIAKAEWLKLADLAFEAELAGQREAKRETKKAGGCVSGFLHAYGVTTDLDEKSLAAGNESAFPNSYSLMLKDATVPALEHATYADCAKLRAEKGQDGDIFNSTCEDLQATNWLVAWNHSTGRSSSIEGRQAAWDKKFASIKADFLDLGASEEKATEKALLHAGKRPEAKSA